MPDVNVKEDVKKVKYHFIKSTHVG